MGHDDSNIVPIRMLICTLHISDETDNLPRPLGERFKYVQVRLWRLGDVLTPAAAISVHVQSQGVYIL